MYKETNAGTLWNERVTVQRLLGQALLEHSPSAADRDEGQKHLREALSLAEEREFAPEMELITEILERDG